MSAKNLFERLKTRGYRSPGSDFSSPKTESPRAVDTSPSTQGSLNLGLSFEQAASPSPAGSDEFFLPPPPKIEQPPIIDFDTASESPTVSIPPLPDLEISTVSQPSNSSQSQASSPSAANLPIATSPKPLFARYVPTSPISPSNRLPSSPLAPQDPFLAAIAAAEYPQPLPPGTSDPFDPFSELTPVLTLADSYSNPPSPTPPETPEEEEGNELADLMEQTSLTGGASQIPEPASPQQPDSAPKTISTPVPPFVRETNVKNNTSDDTIRIMGFLSTGIALSGLPCVMSFPEVLGVTESRRFVVTYSSSLCSAIRRASRSLDRILVEGDLGYPTPFSTQLKPFLSLLPKDTYSVIYSKESGLFNYIPFDNNNRVQIYTPRVLCFLGTKSPDEVDKERVEWFRERIREGKRPPILTLSETEKWLQWGSGMDHFIIDGHCRIAAYMAEGISPPILDIRTTRNRDKNLYKEDLLFFNESTATYRDKAASLQQRYIQLLSQDTERHGFDEDGDDKCVVS